MNIPGTIKELTEDLKKIETKTSGNGNNKEEGQIKKNSKQKLFGGK